MLIHFLAFSNCINQPLYKNVQEKCHCLSIVIVNHKHHIVFCTGFLPVNFWAFVLHVVEIPFGTNRIHSLDIMLLKMNQSVTLLEIAVLKVRAWSANRQSCCNKVGWSELRTLWKNELLYDISSEGGCSLQAHKKTVTGQYWVDRRPLFIYLFIYCTSQKSIYRSNPMDIGTVK